VSEEAKGGNNKGMMMVIMVMLGLIIVALVGVSIFLISSLGNDEGNNAGQGVFEQAPPPTVMDTIPLSISNVTTNLLPRANGNRHVVLLSTVALSINNLDEDEAADFVAAVSLREPAVIDAITTVLRRTTPEELEAVGGHEVLKENLLIALQTAFGSHMIVDVQFQILVH